MDRWDQTTPKLAYDQPNCVPSVPGVKCNDVGLHMVRFSQGKFEYFYNFRTGSDYTARGTYSCDANGALTLTFASVDGLLVASSCVHPNDGWKNNVASVTTTVTFDATYATFATSNAANGGTYVPLNTVFAGNGGHTMRMRPVTRAEFYGNDFPSNAGYRHARGQCYVGGAVCDPECTASPTGI